MFTVTHTYIHIAVDDINAQPEVGKAPNQRVFRNKVKNYRIEVPFLFMCGRIDCSLMCIYVCMYVCVYLRRSQIGT